jgi:hypothetical protein
MPSVTFPGFQKHFLLGASSFSAFKFKGQFRFEVFNLANTPLFDNVNTYVRSVVFRADPQPGKLSANQLGVGFSY